MRLHCCGWLAVLLQAAGCSWGGGSESPPLVVSEETTFITEPLSDDGYPDYVAALDSQASAGIVPAQNAMLGYLRAYGPSVIEEGKRARYFEKLGIDPLPEEGDYLLSFTDYIGTLNLTEAEADSAFQETILIEEYFDSATPEEFPYLSDWLAAMQTPLAHVRNASEQLYCYRPLFGKGNLELGQRSSFDMGRIFDADRTAAYLLETSARLHALAGDTNAAILDLAMVHRLARHIAQGPRHVDLLRASSLVAASFYVEEQLLSLAPLTAAQAALMHEHWGSFQPLPSLAKQENLGGRFHSLDSAIAGMLAGPTNTDELERLLGDAYEDFAPPEYMAKFAEIADWNSTLRYMNNHHTEVVEALRLPDYQSRREALETLQAKLEATRASIGDPETFFEQKWDRPEAELIGEYLAAEKLEITCEGISMILMPGATHTQAIDEMERIAVALAQYRALEDEYPNSLNRLLPEYLTSLPADPYTGQAFGYRLTDSGYLLYSFGTNAIDDGGTSSGQDWENEHFSEGGDDFLFVIQHPE